MHKYKRVIMEQTKVGNPWREKTILWPIKEKQSILFHLMIPHRTFMANAIKSSLFSRNTNWKDKANYMLFPFKMNIFISISIGRSVHLLHCLILSVHTMPQFTQCSFQLYIAFAVQTRGREETFKPPGTLRRAIYKLLLVPKQLEAR